MPFTVELERALSYPKIRNRVSEIQADRLVTWVRENATIVPDLSDPPSITSRDPGEASMTP